MLTREIVKNRRLHIQPRPALLSFNANRRRTQNDFKIVEELMLEFGQQSTIHGLNRVFAAKVGLRERFLWTLGFFSAFSTLIYVSLFLATRYNRAQFKTVVNTTNYPIYKIAFPEVVICNQNRLNWARFADAREKFLQPAHQADPELSQLFTDVVALYDTFTFGTFERFARLKERPLEKLNYINFTNVAAHLAWRCDELLDECMWRHTAMNCCSIFVPRRSQLGMCWAFNSIETLQGKMIQLMDTKWPWHPSHGGVGNGLSFKVYIKERQHSPFARTDKGITFTVFEPGVWTSYPVNVRMQTRTNVRLDGQLCFYDNQTRRLSSSERECVFDDEHSSHDFKSLRGFKYMFENCQSQCQQEHMIKFCNCTVDLFFPPSSFPICQLVDMPCLARHNKRLLYFAQPGEVAYVSTRIEGMVCQCFLNCQSLTYLTDVRSTMLHPFELNSNDSHIEMDFYFKRDTIVSFRTNVIYTWVDLLVSFGGAVTLFLGCSLISIVELVYYFLVHLPQRLWQAHHTVRTRKDNEY